MNTQHALMQLIRSELKRYETLYDKLNAQMPLLPKGSVALRRGQPYRVVRENEKQFFARLTIDEEDLLRELKLRRFNTKALPVLKRCIDACRTFLKSAVIYDPEQIINSLPVQYANCGDLDIWLDGDIDPVKWANEEYHSNPMEIAIPHFTAGGLKTRSKSEEIIGTRLEENAFIIRYEPELLIGKQRLYPDFAILLTQCRKVVYWEHLGLIDNPEYVIHNLKKLEQYANIGIYPGINLILTYETKEHPLTVMEVDKKIRELQKLEKRFAVAF